MADHWEWIILTMLLHPAHSSLLYFRGKCFARCRFAPSLPTALGFIHGSILSEFCLHQTRGDSKCRKATGTAFATNTPINAADFKLVTGESLLSEFESTPNVFRVFCKNCGSPLYSRRTQTPEVIRLRIGTLDSAIDDKPTAHVFVASKADWYEISDDLPQYAERP